MTHHVHQDNDARTEGLAVGLGWFSLALGAVGMVAPREVARFIGAPDDPRTASLLRAYGAREIGTGLALLAQPDQPAWLWSRVAGDVLDLASLGAIARSDRADGSRLGPAIGIIAGVAVLDALAAIRLERTQARRWQQAPEGRPAPHAVQVERVTTVNRPIEEVYRFWRSFENFPRFMRHLTSVENLGEGRTRWRASGPGGVPVQWDAQTTDERDNERIAWRSLEGATVDNRGSVEFRRAPGARGTEVRVRLEYRPPAGALGRGVAWLVGKDPEQQVHEDLHRVKQLLETGEVALSDGPSLRRPAQPAREPREIFDLAGVQR